MRPFVSPLGGQQMDRTESTFKPGLSRRHLVRGALASGGAAAGALVLSKPAAAQTMVDATALHQTGDETKTGELTLTPANADSKALVLRAASGQSVDVLQVQRPDGQVQGAWDEAGGLTVYGGDNASPRPFEMWVRRNGTLNPTGPSVYINSGGHLRLLSSLVVSGRTVGGNEPVLVPSNALHMLGVWSDVAAGHPAMVVRANYDVSPVFWGLDTWGYRRVQVDGDGTIRWAPPGAGNSRSQAGLMANNAPVDAALGRGTLNGGPALSVTGAPLAITPAATNKQSLVIQTLTGQTADVMNVLDPAQNSVFRVTRAGGVYTVAHPNRVSGVFQSSNTVGVTVGSESNHMFSVITNNKFRTRWESDGNIGLNGNISSYGGGTGVVAVANAVSPPSGNPSGGFLLYGAGGYLQVRSATGDVFDTARQAAIPSPSEDTASLKQAVDAIRVTLQKLGVIA